MPFLHEGQVELYPQQVVYLLYGHFNAPNQGYADAEVLNRPLKGVQQGQLTIVEVDGTLAVVGNKCAFTAQGTPDWGDLGFYSQAITRALGRGLLATVYETAGETIYPVGFMNTTDLLTASREYGIYFNNTPAIRISVPAATQELVAIVASTTYQLAIVLGGFDTNGVPWRSGQAAASYLYGAAFFIQGGAFTNWTLLWRTATSNTTPLYAALRTNEAVGTLDDFRVPDLDLSAVLQPNNLSLFASAGELSAYTPEVGGVWTEDIGDWDTAGGVLQATALGIATFTGLANCIYDAKITTPGAGTTAGGLVLRETDLTGGSEDYWYVKVTPGTAGVDWELIEYVAGGATQRASGDVDWAAATAYNIRAICDGQTISCFADGGDMITYASAASGEAATSFGLRDEGNANMTFDNGALFARISSVYDREFDRV